VHYFFIRIFAHLIAVLFLGAVIGYTSYNTAKNSIISTTEVLVDLEYQTLPGTSETRHTENQYSDRSESWIQISIQSL
jgi:hypothetical protein